MAPPGSEPIITGRFFTALAFVEKREGVMQVCKLMSVDFFAGRTNPARIRFRFIRAGDILSKGEGQREIATAIRTQKKKGMRNAAFTVGSDEALFQSRLTDDLSELHAGFFSAKIQP